MVTGKEEKFKKNKWFRPFLEKKEDLGKNIKTFVLNILKSRLDSTMGID